MTTTPGPDLLSSTPGLREVEYAALEALLAGAAPMSLPRGAPLYSAGDEYHRRVYVLLEGEVESERPNGRRERPARGYLLGLSSYLNGAGYGSSVRATRPARLLALGHAHLSATEQRFPSLRAAFDRMLAAGYRDRSVATFVGSSTLGRHASELMHSLDACSPDTPLGEVLERLDEAPARALLVESGDDRLLTLDDRTVARALGRGGRCAADATEAALAVAAEDPLWLMRDLVLPCDASHAVVTRAGKPVGMLGLRSVFSALAAEQRDLATRARNVVSFDHLREHGADVADACQQALESNRRTRFAAGRLSKTHRARMRRTVELTLDTLARDGHGEPPARFALLLLGAGGRHEMAVEPRQENALVIADVAPSRRDAVERWFAHFADAVCSNLEHVGFPLGGSIHRVSNRAYRDTLQRWEARIDALASGRTPNDVAWLELAIDVDTLFGDESLVRMLRRHAFERLSDNAAVIGALAARHASLSPALGRFGALSPTGRTDAGPYIDIGAHGLEVISGGARLAALQHRIESTTTCDRLLALMRAGALDRGVLLAALEGFDQLLAMQLGHQVRRARTGEDIDSNIQLDALTDIERMALRASLHAARRFQRSLRKAIRSPATGRSRPR